MASTIKRKDQGNICLFVTSDGLFQYQVANALQHEEYFCDFSMYNELVG